MKHSRAGVPEIVALSVDTPERSAELKRELALPFRLLCDPEKSVVKGWGLYNPEKGGIAKTATFGLDRERRIVFRSIDTMVSRATGEQAIQAVMAPAPAKAEAPRKAVLPSPWQIAKALWFAFRHGLGPPRR